MFIVCFHYVSSLDSRALHNSHKHVALLVAVCLIVKVIATVVVIFTPGSRSSPCDHGSFRDRQLQEWHYLQGSWICRHRIAVCVIATSTTHIVKP